VEEIACAQRLGRSLGQMPVALGFSPSELHCTLTVNRKKRELTKTGFCSKSSHGFKSHSEGNFKRVF
jgi:hypothetical protein